MNWVASRKETRDGTVSQQRAVQSPCERCCCGATVCPNRLLPSVDGIARSRRPRKTDTVWPRLAAMDRYRPMRWLYNRRLGSWLALAALALQFVVSFGHVHLDGVRRTFPALAVSGSGAQASQLSVPHPGNDADGDYCAICATIYLAATSFLPPAPQLPVPQVSRTIEHFARVAVDFIVPRRAPFQSRAPPLA